MNKHDDGGHAFPHSRLGSDANGMTLRDYFAAKAMHAMTTGSWPDRTETKEIAERAYRMADAMLEARK